MVGQAQPTGARARQHAHILDTVLASLAQDGYQRMSIEGLAARAGVNKTTLYRWWSGKAALVADALAQHMDTAPLPDTGATRADLLAWLRATAASHASIDAGITVPALIGDLAATDGASQAFLENFLARQRAGWAELVRRGIERGDLPGSTDVDLFFDVMSGTVFYRQLLCATPISEDLPERILDLLLGPV